ncbi:MAG: hypothetical protein A2Y76_13205 [Planctomycetes bacterium RBG_13_60_9]|nr:MAG: hypothetical protein A2Y76_13205 [Planctomycetes bacterium RBG_13_60_9]
MFVSTFFGHSPFSALPTWMIITLITIQSVPGGAGEERLFTIPPACDMPSLTLSDSGTHWAALSRQAGSVSVLVDGEIKGTFKEVGPIVFGPLGSQVFYCAQEEDGRYSLVAGSSRMEPPFAVLPDRCTAFFSDDGSSCGLGLTELITDAKGEKGPGRYGVVWNAKWLGVWQEVTYPVVSLDGKHVAFFVCDGNRMQIIVDGVPKESMAVPENTMRIKDNSTGVVSVMFSKPKIVWLQDNVLAYVGPCPKGWCVSKGGQTLAEYPCLDWSGGNALYSEPVGQTGAAIYSTSLTTSSDGAGLVWWVCERIEGKKVWKVMGENGPTGITTEMDPSWNPARPSLWLASDGRTITYVGGQTGRSTICRGDWKSSAFEIVGPPVFSPDGQKVAFTAQEKNTLVKVVGDQRVGSRYTSTGLAVFSPDSQRLAYRAKMKAGWHVVVEGKEGKSYDQILSGPVFDKAGRMSYVARQGADVFLLSED